MAGRMKISPIWRAVAEAPNARPAVMVSQGVRVRRQSRAASPATISASNMTSGMMFCSICTW